MISCGDDNLNHWRFEMEKKMEKVVQVMENCDNFIEKEEDFFRQITLEQIANRLETLDF